jgi:hypothetical protein
LRFELLLAASEPPPLQHKSIETAFFAGQQQQGGPSGIETVLILQAAVVTLGPAEGEFSSRRAWLATGHFGRNPPPTKDARWQFLEQLGLAIGNQLLRTYPNNVFALTIRCDGEVGSAVFAEE